jgi:hypothetical protein
MVNVELSEELRKPQAVVRLGGAAVEAPPHTVDQFPGLQIGHLVRALFGPMSDRLFMGNA